MIKNIIAILAGVVLVLFILKSTARLPNEKPNGFKRKLTANPLMPLKQVPLKVALESICGTKSGDIYFTTPHPGWLIRLDTTLTRQDTFAFGLPAHHEIPGAHETVADAPRAFLFANNIPAVYSGNWEQQSFDTLYRPANTFSRAVYMPPNNIVLRVLDSSLQRQRLQRINIHTKHIEAENDLFAAQENGGFDRDGLLRYDTATKRLFYIELYRNAFYCMDTSLHLLYTGHTIDTMLHNPISVQWVKWENEKRLMPAKARTSVTQDAVVANGYLFIVSNLKADNERGWIFNHNAVVDMYRVQDGSYYGSFYIPRYNDEKLKSFAVYNDRVVALYTSQVATFKWQPL